MKKTKNILLWLVLAMSCTIAEAQLRLPSIFTSNMVLQQKSEVAIWGWADAITSVEIKTSWNNQSYTVSTDKNGKWKTKISTAAYGGPYEVSIKANETITLNNVMLGEVWLCAGQSNMEMPMKGFMGQPILGGNMDIVKSKNSNIRLISVPRASKTEPQDNFEGQWNEANPETVANFSATAYYYGRMLNEMLDIPVGLIDVSFGGSCIQAWMSENTAVPFEDVKIPKTEKDIKEKNRTPTVLFNGMLSPVIGYGIKGAIWYQGETNYIEPDKYEELFPTMVKEWRSLWNQGDFPFYYAQIAPFDYSVFTPTEFHEKYNSAYLRDAQRKAQETIPNSGMAVLMDIGEETSIHPMHKQVGGERLALWALAKTYEIPGINYQSPQLNAIEIKEGQVVVSFKDINNGLTTFGKELTGFEIAGADKRFYPATAFLRSKSVVLSSPRVSQPVAVRYAFKDFIVGTLFGTNGLPVSSFRTDDW